MFVFVWFGGVEVCSWGCDGVSGCCCVQKENRGMRLCVSQQNELSKGGGWGGGDGRGEGGLEEIGERAKRGLQSGSCNDISPCGV